MISCRMATTPEQIEAARALFREYAAAVDEPACFRSFELEVANLPGDYGPARGRLLLAGGDEEDAGCVALRSLSEETGEIKRLYVREAFRGRGIARLLVEALVREARAIGYRTLRLDTLPTMTAAIALYRGLDFREISAYTFNPVEGTLFFEKAL